MKLESVQQFLRVSGKQQHFSCIYSVSSNIISHNRTEGTQRWERGTWSWAQTTLFLPSCQDKNHPALLVTVDYYPHQRIFLLFRVLFVLEFLSVPLRALFPLPNPGCGLLAVLCILDFALGAPCLYKQQVCAKGMMLNKERSSLVLN